MCSSPALLVPGGLPTVSRVVQLPPLSVRWQAISRLGTPDTPEVLKMLQELERVHGVVLLAGLLGCPVAVLEHWLRGRRYPSGAAVRAVWLLWALTLHPERCRSVGDILTWGRFVTTKQRKV